MARLRGLETTRGQGRARLLGRGEQQRDREGRGFGQTARGGRAWLLGGEALLDASDPAVPGYGCSGTTRGYGDQGGSESGTLGRVRDHTTRRGRAALEQGRQLRLAMTMMSGAESAR